jgi:hypothetical protein
MVAALVQPQPYVSCLFGSAAALGDALVQQQLWSLLWFSRIYGRCFGSAASMDAALVQPQL